MHPTCIHILFETDIRVMHVKVLSSVRNMDYILPFLLIGRYIANQDTCEVDRAYFCETNKSDQ